MLHVCSSWSEKKQRMIDVRSVIPNSSVEVQICRLFQDEIKKILMLTGDSQPTTKCYQSYSIDLRKYMLTKWPYLSPPSPKWNAWIYFTKFFSHKCEITEKYIWKVYTIFTMREYLSRPRMSYAWFYSSVFQPAVKEELEIF